MSSVSHFLPDPGSGPDPVAGRGTVIALVGAKGAPGATTSAVALALGWPRSVLLVDADPAGGDLGVGWLAGRVGSERGLLSFAAATRHTDTPSVAELAAHVMSVPDAPRVLVLLGLAHAGQSGGLPPQVWTRLVSAATAPWPPPETDADSAGVPVDMLVDCGRLGPDTHWPLLASARTVLLVTRPTLRGAHHARVAVAALSAELGDTRRVSLLVCGPGPYGPGEVGRAVGLSVAVTLPADAAAAHVLSDSASPSRGWPRTLLARAAQAAARSLASAGPSADRGAGRSRRLAGSGPDRAPGTEGESR